MPSKICSCRHTIIFTFFFFFFFSSLDVKITDNITYHKLFKHLDSNKFKLYTIITLSIENNRSEQTMSR